MKTSVNLPTDYGRRNDRSVTETTLFADKGLKLSRTAANQCLECARRSKHAVVLVFLVETCRCDLDPFSLILDGSPMHVPLH